MDVLWKSLVYSLRMLLKRPIATALMWTWYLLSQHPEVEARLHAEVDDVLGSGGPATFDDLPRLRYTESVLAESMRLYPPTWRLVRRAKGRCTACGYDCGGLAGDAAACPECGETRS